MTPYQSFPLHWPLGLPRTAKPQRSRFKNVGRYAAKEIMDDLRRFKATDIIISSNVPLRNNGLPRASYGKIQDTGAAVYFSLPQPQGGYTPVVLACDKWDTVEDNLRAIGKTIDAMRGLERWGCSDVVNRTFTGFKALPAPVEGDIIPWHQVLGCSPTITRDELRAHYRALCKTHHPDLGGDPEAFRRITEAYNKGMEER
jgi:DnaJ-like protein